MRRAARSKTRTGLLVSVVVIMLLSCQLGGSLAPGDEEPTSEPVASGETAADTPEPVVETAGDEGSASPEPDPTIVPTEPEEANEPQEDVPPSPSSDVETISLEDLKTELPDDIVEQLSFAHGGGPGAECDATLPHDRQDTVVADGYMSIDTCLWDEDELVEVVVLSPGGKELLRETKRVLRSYTSSNSVTWTVNVYYVYDPLDFELGKPYVFRFESDTKSATVEATLVPADHPVKGFSGDTTVFYNFQPGELVDVYYYVPIEGWDENDPLSICGLAAPDGFDFAGWKTYQADDNGRLILAVTQDARFQDGRVNYYGADHYLAAVGQGSGEAIDPAIMFSQDSVIARQSRAEREELKEACYDGHAAAEELIVSSEEFLAAAFASKAAAYRNSDPQMAQEFYAGDAYETIETAISALDETGVYAVNVFDTANSYTTNELPIVYADYRDGLARGMLPRVLLNSCELWQTSLYSKADQRLLQEEPKRLASHYYRIELTSEGTWKIVESEFTNPSLFCGDMDPALYVSP